ncbi:MAG: serpin family protein [Bacteroidales bacterium]|nr:serpin family protein [Bacteroidales bacterium]
MKSIMIISFLILIGFTACKPKSDVINESENNYTDEKVVIDKPVAIKEVTLKLDESVKIVKKSQNDKLTDFAFKSFSEMTSEKPEKNTAYSPVSLNIAMGMVYSGARNATASEISNVMGFNKHDENFFGEFSDYLNYLNSLAIDTALDFNLANRVFLENTYEILPEYRAVISKYFDGAFQNCDFRNNYRIEEKNINTWVSKMTKDRINNLLPDGILDETTRMVLVNAIYIKSKWKYPFDKARTRERDFFVNQGRTVKVDFMIQKQEWIKYCDMDGYQVIELPYTSKDLSLLIILPKNSNSENLHDLIPSGDLYMSFCRNMKYEEVYMEIPKFNTQSSFMLAKDLNKMGIKSAFGAADFSGITADNDLAISEVIQKVFFEMDEKGSEAAAATAVVMYYTSSVSDYNPKITYNFIANRPFIYVLKENRYNTPLFIGQFVDLEE